MLLEVYGDLLKTQIALGTVTRWKQTLVLLASSYWYCDDSKNDLYQL